MNNVKKKSKLQIMHTPSLDKDGEEEIIKEVGSILEGDDLLKQIDQAIKIHILLKKIQEIKPMANNTIIEKKCGNGQNNNKK